MNMPCTMIKTNYRVLKCTRGSKVFFYVQEEVPTLWSILPRFLCPKGKPLVKWVDAGLNAYKTQKEAEDAVIALDIGTDEIVSELTINKKSELNDY